MTSCAVHNESVDHFTLLSGVEMAFQNKVHAQASTENSKVWRTQIKKQIIKKLAFKKYAITQVNTSGCWKQFYTLGTPS